MSKRSVTLACSVCGRVFVQGSRQGPLLMCGGCFGEGRGWGLGSFEGFDLSGFESFDLSQFSAENKRSKRRHISRKGAATCFDWVVSKRAS
jgi:hypothetical protein